MVQQVSLLTMSEAYSEFFTNMERDSFVDISHIGRWRLSSYKGELGLSALLENDPTTFWQSDGDLPHFVEIQFSKLVDISLVCIFTDISLDDSYTPQRIHVYAGFGRHKLVKVQSYELSHPAGWSYMMLDQQGPTKDRPVQCTLLRVEFTKNFSNGKDLHLRGLRIVGPRPRNLNKSPLNLGFKRL